MVVRAMLAYIFLAIGPTIDYPATSLDPREKIRAAPSAIFLENRKRFCGTRKARVFPLGRIMSVIGGNSEVKALREFFAV
jgi:hypothetical protein